MDISTRIKHDFYFKLNFKNWAFSIVSPAKRHLSGVTMSVPEEKALSDGSKDFFNAKKVSRKFLSFLALKKSFGALGASIFFFNSIGHFSGWFKDWNGINTHKKFKNTHKKLTHTHKSLKTPIQVENHPYKFKDTHNAMKNTHK